MVLAGRAVIWARVVVADGSTKIRKEGNEMITILRNDWQEKNAQKY